MNNKALVLRTDHRNNCLRIVLFFVFIHFFVQCWTATVSRISLIPGTCMLPWRLCPSTTTPSPRFVLQFSAQHTHTYTRKRAHAKILFCFLFSLHFYNSFIALRFDSYPVARGLLMVRLQSGKTLQCVMADEESTLCETKWLTSYIFLEIVDNS